MSYLVAAPEFLASAASDLSNIRSGLTAAHAVAAAPTTGMLAAASDEVSAAITSVFSSHAQQFQALSAQAAAFHDQFVQTLNSGAWSYASTEAANASPMLQQVLKGAQVAQLGSWGQTLENLPGLPGQFDRAMGNGFAFVEQEIQQAPTTLAAGFSHELDSLFSAPGSPLLALFTGNNPLLGLFIGNTPPQLLPLLLGETVQHTTFDGMSVVQITPAHPDGHYVVAIHGGAFIFPPSIFHWLDYTVMAYQTGATIEVPIYPLMQQGGTAGTVVPNMAGLISTEIAAHGASHVSVIGDSAGGNLALAAVQYMVSQGEPVPASMVLLSPELIAAGQIGKVWAGNLAVTNPLVSPLYGSLSGLPPTYVYSGSMDPLSGEAFVLQQAAVAQKAPISFVLAHGQIHDWIILTPTGALKYWPQIDQQLGA
jgi:triacylglycerol lipase